MDMTTDAELKAAFEHADHALAEAMRERHATYATARRAGPTRRTSLLVGAMAAACLVTIAGLAVVARSYRSSPAAAPAAAFWAVVDGYDGYVPLGMSRTSDTLWESSYGGLDCRTASFAIRLFPEGTYPDEAPATTGTAVGQFSLRRTDGSTIDAEVRSLAATNDTFTFEAFIAPHIRFEVIAHGLDQTGFVDLLRHVTEVPEASWAALAATTPRAVPTCADKP